MMAIQEDPDKEYEPKENQETKVANLCMMINIISDNENTMVFSKPPLSYYDLMNAYDKLLNNIQTIIT